MLSEISRRNPAQMDRALQLERVARQYAAHRELQQYLGKSNIHEHYEDEEGHLQVREITPSMIFAERYVRGYLARTLGDSSLVVSLTEKFLLPGETI
jgi:hypothetical protein